LLFCGHSYSLLYTGRSVTIGENDFDTLLPDVVQREEDEPWAPAHCDEVQIAHVPVPGRIMSCFRAAASLCESVFFPGVNFTIILLY
jgi:hypothetical protein